jgi:hypothetical protein
MTTNRLAKSEAPQKLSAQQWCDRGNAVLAGTEATTKGEYLPPRNDVHWFVENGRPTIGWRRR